MQINLARLPARLPIRRLCFGSSKFYVERQKGGLHRGEPAEGSGEIVFERRHPMPFWGQRRVRRR